MSGQQPASFGEALRRHRLAAGLTQERLAERSGVGVRSIQGLERGETQPLRETLHRLIAALQLMPDPQPSSSEQGSHPHGRIARYLRWRAQPEAVEAPVAPGVTTCRCR
jgi:transcriptional regulator with XRE-family HTH domain